MRTIASFLAFAVIAYVSICTYMYATQRSQIYFPTAESTHHDAQVILLERDGERLKVWSVPRAGPQALIYFGGNAEDVAGSIDAFAMALPEHSLYFVNYRGFGGSSGHPSETALLADALALYDHIRARHSSIALLGRSLGSGVAVTLASERPVARLVLVTPYDSLVNVAQGHFPYLPVGQLMRDRFDAASRARDIAAPVLAVIAPLDEIIPEARSAALVAAFTEGQVKVEVIPGAGHNTLDQSPAYFEAVRAFLAERSAGQAQ